MGFFKLNTPHVNSDYFDTEVLIANIATEKYYSIMGTSAVFLRLLLDGNSDVFAVNKLAELYAVDNTIVADDYTVFLAHLQAEQLLISSTPSASVLKSDWLALINTTQYEKPTVEVFTDLEELELV
jgi:hypothetical protein